MFGFFSLNQEKGLNFVNIFLHQLKWSYVFPTHSVNMVYYINYFSHCETFLRHSRNKSYLIMMHHPFNVLLNSVCLYFVEDLFINTHKILIYKCGGFFLLFLLVVSIWFGIYVICALWNELENIFSSSIFRKAWKGLVLLKYLVEFMPEAIWTWTFLSWKVFDHWLNLLTIGLFRFSISSWFSLGKLYVSVTLSTSLRLPSFLAYNCASCSFNL